MSRQETNKQFLQTSFLNGVNAPYIEELQSQYDKNPSSVTDEWRHFFESLKDDRKPGGDDGARNGEPSWAPPLAELQGTSTELIAALTGDYGEDGARRCATRSSSRRTSMAST